MGYGERCSGRGRFIGSLTDEIFLVKPRRDAFSGCADSRAGGTGWRLVEGFFFFFFLLSFFLSVLFLRNNTKALDYGAARCGSAGLLYAPRLELYACGLGWVGEIVGQFVCGRREA